MRKTSPFMVRRDDTFAEKLANLALSGVQVVQVQTTEETRLLADVRRAAALARAGDQPPWNVVEWGVLQGFAGVPQPVNNCAGNPMNALLAVGSDAFKVADPTKHTRASHVGVVESVEDAAVVVTGRRYDVPHDQVPVVDVGQAVTRDQVLAGGRRDTTFVVFKDLAPFLNMEDPRARRALRDLFEAQALNNLQHRRVIVLAGPVAVVHREVAYLMTNLDYPLPDEGQLLEVVDEIAAGAGHDTVDAGLRQKIATAMTGFTRTEACDAMAKVVTVMGGLCPANPATVGDFSRDLLREIHLFQAAAWKNERAMTLYDTADVAAAADVGGYDLFLDWIRESATAYTEAGRRFHADRPRGVVLAGVPGSGKSMVAKMLARELSVPLIILSMGDVFGSLLGDSEAMMTHVLKRITAKGRCVVVLDEMDRMLGGMNNDGKGDSGVGARLLGKLQTWQAETTSGAFVVGTLNRLGALQPEQLRKGRFDEVFFVDLPGAVERAAILRIQLRKRHLDAAALYTPAEIERLVAVTDGFVGSEIEQGVVDSIRRTLYHSGGDTGVPTFAVLLDRLQATTPSSRQNPEGIRAIQDFFRTAGARPVSSGVAPMAGAVVQTPSGKIRRSRSVGGDPASN